MLRQHEFFLLGLYRNFLRIVIQGTREKVILSGGEYPGTPALAGGFWRDPGDALFRSAFAGRECISQLMSAQAR